jgi:hypothetical protein
MSNVDEVKQNEEIHDDLVMRKPKEVQVSTKEEIDNELEIAKPCGQKAKPVKASVGPGGRRTGQPRKDPRKKTGPAGGSSNHDVPLSGFPEDIEDEEDALAAIMADPCKFTSMINDMNKGGDDIMSKVIQDVAGNPEARKAVESMVGDKAKAEKLRSAMMSRGAKMPKRKELLKLDKDRKNAMRQGDPTGGMEKVDCLHLTAARKFKVVKSVLGGQVVCVFQKDRVGSVGVYEIGDIKVAYLNDIKVNNKKVLALLRDFLPKDATLGNEVVFFHKHGEHLTEKSLMSYLVSLPKDTVAVLCRPFEPLAGPSDSQLLGPTGPSYHSEEEDVEQEKQEEDVEQEKQEEDVEEEKQEKQEKQEEDVEQEKQEE